MKLLQNCVLLLALADRVTCRVNSCNCGSSLDKYGDTFAPFLLNGEVTPGTEFCSEGDSSITWTNAEFYRGADIGCRFGTEADEHVSGKEECIKKFGAARWVTHDPTQRACGGAKCGENKDPNYTCRALAKTFMMTDGGVNYKANYDKNHDDSWDDKTNTEIMDHLCKDKPELAFWPCGTTTDPIIDGVPWNTKPITQAPTKWPTQAPTQAPTPPTQAPTNAPTQAPTKAPTKPPTEAPTKAPTPIRTCSCHPQPSKFSGLVCFRRDFKGNPECMSNWHQPVGDSNAPWAEKENFDLEKECEKIRPGEEEKGPGELIQHNAGEHRSVDKYPLNPYFSCWNRDDPSNPRHNEQGYSAGTSQHLSFFAAAFALVAFFWQ